jgi:CRP/FNR family cyclic AMP-dependent transcriptional regulator
LRRLPETHLPDHLVAVFLPAQWDRPTVCVVGRQALFPLSLAIGCGILAVTENPFAEGLIQMTGSPAVLKQVPLFALFDDEEIAVLAGQVEIKTFAARQRIYKIGDASGLGYVLLSGSVAVSTLDQDNQEVVVDHPGPGEFFGFASMLGQTPHQTDAVSAEESVCIEIDRNDIFTLLQHKPHAGMDLLAVLGHQMHAAQELVRRRAMRNANEIIEEEATRGERIADGVARFGGSWAFIISFGVVLVVYSTVNVALRHKAWDPYPFILLNLFLSMLAAIQAPVIMMSQNRQDQRDRVRSELDYDVNRRAESEIQGLARKVNLVNERIGDLEDLLRERVPAAPPGDAIPER